MSISITINGESVDAVQQDMRAFLGGEPQVRPAQPEQPAVSGEVSQPEKPARKPRGAKAAVTDVKDENEQPQQAIQTGGEREPEKAPEAEAPKPLTLDDVRNAAKPYIQKFGMPAASSDLTPCLKAATGCEAISQLEGKDQATLKAAVDAFVAAGEGKFRYGHTA